MVYMKIIRSIFNITDMEKKSFIGLCFLSFARGIFYIFYINYIKEMMNCLINRQFQEVYLYIGLFILFAILQLLVKYIFDMFRNKEQAVLEAHVKKKYFDKLSTAGGEKGRIALARAFYKPTPIILLDEVYASLDNAAILEIEQAIQELCKLNCCILFVTHRLEWIPKDSRIYCLDSCM